MSNLFPEDVVAAASQAALADDDYRTIERFPGYRFCANGSVWSAWVRKGTATHIGESWRQIRHFVNRNGYCYVDLRIAASNYKRIGVHQAIAEAFIGERPDGMDVCHYPDPTRSNNTAANLRYGTRSQNLADRHRQGTSPSVLSEAVVRTARTEHAAGGIGHTRLAKKYGVSKSVMRNAIIRKTWRHLT